MMDQNKTNPSRFWQLCSLILFLILLGLGVRSGYLQYLENHKYKVVSELAGNIFPSAILSTASTGTQVIQPGTTHYLGNPQVGFGIKLVSPKKNCKVHIELSSTHFFQQSVSDFVMPEKDVEYTIYPDVLWDYGNLKQNTQALPISFSISVKVGYEKPVQQNVTYSVRSINDCLLCYKDEKMNFHDTSIYFAAYVNEEHPMIDNLLREALNTKIVSKFVGLQLGESKVDAQVYALWNMLQKRNFKYSSVSYSSTSSNMVYCQRVRTIDDALENSQVNCVDGTVLFSSLLRAINIIPVMIRVPGHMFVGYYTDSQKKNLEFLETTMIGNVDLNEYFPDEQLDSLVELQSFNEKSRLTYEKAKQYARQKYETYKEKLQDGNGECQMLEISKNIRSKVQSIGR